MCIGIRRRGYKLLDYNGRRLRRARGRQPGYILRRKGRAKEVTVLRKPPAIQCLVRVLGVPEHRLPSGVSVINVVALSRLSSRESCHRHNVATTSCDLGQRVA